MYKPSKLERAMRAYFEAANPQGAAEYIAARNGIEQQNAMDAARDAGFTVEYYVNSVRVHYPNPPKGKLDKQLIERCAGPINAVWQYIGYEVESVCAENHVRVSNEDAVESCIDAGRLREYPAASAGGIEADNAIKAAIKVHGYRKVLCYLARHISLT